MSFGFGVGDIIAVSTLARKVWGRFRDSSDQFNAIQTEVAGLCLTLDDIANSLSRLQTTDKQAEDLSTLIAGCRGVLDDTEQYIQKNESLGTESTFLGSKTRKAWRKLKWDPTVVNELRDRMVANATYLNAFNASLANQASRATSDKVNIIADGIQILNQDQGQKKREEVLQWISSLNFTPQQSAFSSRRQEGTGMWFLESQTFQEWLEKAGKTILCQGIPGAGKTMLASLVIDHLQQISEEDTVVIAYVFCDYRKQDEQTPINLMASIAKQFLQHQTTLPEGAEEIYQRHRKKATRPGFDESLEMIRISMTHCSRFYLVIDALDELGHAGQVRQILTAALRRLQDSHQLNLMITSRYTPSLASEYHQPLCVDIQASPYDIKRYVDGRILDLPSCVKKSSELQETIATAIVKTVDGMFLLAQLHMDSLRDKTSVKLIKKALETLPTGSKALDLAYDGAMRRIEDQLEGFRLYAIRVLGWLTHSKRLMTIKELQHALAIEPDTSEFDADDIIDIDEVVGFCAGLVIVDDETKNIRLVHYTTQEYFRRNGDIVLASARQEIATSCLTYLLYEEFGDGWIMTAESDESKDDDGQEAEENVEEKDEEKEEEEDKDPGDNFKGALKDRVRRYPFLAYAARHWADHVELCAQEDVEELMVRFAKDAAKISSASQVIFTEDDDDYSFWSEPKQTLTAIHLLAYLGCQELISKLLGYGLVADVEDSAQRTPLWWAASQGHQAVVELLLSQDHVNVNKCGFWFSSSRSREFCTPLGIAVYKGNGKIVGLLISREDVDVNLNRPIYHAVFKGHSTVLDLLLTRKDIDINSRAPDGRDLLATATRYGGEDIVLKLLKMGNIQVNLRDYCGHSPLNHASQSGHERIVKSLLELADIEVNSRDVRERTPLLNASDNGREAVVELLISHPNIDVNLKDKDGKTALHFAIKRSSISIVELLLSRSDINVNARDNAGRTPLHQATRKIWNDKMDEDLLGYNRSRVTASTAGEAGKFKLTQTLLNCQRVDKNCKDDEGLTPLAHAMLNSLPDVTKLLCAHHDIDLHLTDKKGRDILALVGERQEQMIERLGEEGAGTHTPALKECLEIWCTAIEKRREYELQNSQTSLHPSPIVRVNVTVPPNISTRIGGNAASVVNPREDESSSSEDAEEESEDSSDSDEDMVSTYEEEE